MNIILDRVAVWPPQTIDGLLTRKMPAGTAYQTKDSLVFKTSATPIIRYVKNYEKNGRKFCLFVRTMNADEKDVEKQLDAIAKSLKIADIKASLADATFDNFDYTEAYLEGGK